MIIIMTDYDYYYGQRDVSASNFAKVQSSGEGNGQQFSPISLDFVREVFYAAWTSYCCTSYLPLWVSLICAAILSSSFSTSSWFFLPWYFWLSISSAPSFLSRKLQEVS